MFSLSLCFGPMPPPVRNFVATLGRGESRVKQMIMGAGKTTVVAPLLALMLADGESLVLSVVPKALLEMSRKQMRETFSTIMAKRIYTMSFDRGTSITPTFNRSLSNARKNRGVVVATPTTLKSIQLVYVETLQRLDDAKRNGPKDRAAKLGAEVTELKAVLETFRGSVLLLDEVDMVLHPLKSELNFPIGTSLRRCLQVKAILLCYTARDSFTTMVWSSHWKTCICFKND